MINETNLIASTDTLLYKPLNKTLILPGDFDYFYADMQRGKIGGQINYHLQDKLRINLAGDYYFWSSDTTIYDRPEWEVALRIDGRIDKHWSLYSDNHFAGNRLVLAYDGTSYTEHHLRPTVDLNVGVQYDMWVGKASPKHGRSDTGVLRPEPKPNFSLFLQLNNWLHRKNEIYYGYRSQGINFLLGATFRF